MGNIYITCYSWQIRRMVSTNPRIYLHRLYQRFQTRNPIHPFQEHRFPEVVVAHPSILSFFTFFASGLIFYGSQGEGVVVLQYNQGCSNPPYSLLTVVFQFFGDSIADFALLNKKSIIGERKVQGESKVQGKGRLSPEEM